MSFDCFGNPCYRSFNRAAKRLYSHREVSTQKWTVHYGMIRRQLGDLCSQGKFHNSPSLVQKVVSLPLCTVIKGLSSYIRSNAMLDQGTIPASFPYLLLSTLLYRLTLRAHFQPLTSLPIGFQAII